MDNRQRSDKNLSAPLLIVWFYLGAIAAGTLLLLLPGCNHAPIRPIDALFSAASAVTGAGLMSVIPAVQFTIAGKIVLLILIQAGGLAIVASLLLFAGALSARISLRERGLIRDMFSLGRLGGAKVFLRRVLLTTLVIEVIGAGLSAAVFIPVYGVGKGSWLGVFHAVSAFCNSGIDLLGASSMGAYSGNLMINLTMTLMVIAGGLGFLTWFDLGGVIFTGRCRHLKVTTKAVLIAAALLLVLGTLAFAATEWSNPDTIGSYSVGGKVAASFYQSVMSRSGGFSVIDQTALRDPSKLFGSLLMIIGGAPFGTAGGLKLTTAIVLLMVVVAAVRGSRDVAMMHRVIPAQTVRAAAVIVISYGALLFMAVFILSALEPSRLIDIVYECSSAIGTAGLSSGITAGLSGVSRVILVILMLAGRLAPVCLMLALGRRKDPRDEVRTLPQEQILIG